MRVHGGAVLKPSVNSFLNFSSRMESMRSEKIELAEISAQFIRNGDTLALDSGSTGIEFIEVLMKHFDTLTIMTPSLDIFQKACEFKKFNIILTGGFFLRGENTLYGEFALKTLDNIRVKKSFVFPSSISLKCGIMGSLPEFVDIQRKMIEISDEVYIVADSSMGIHKIARELNEHGIKSNSSESWTEKKVRYILSNEKYIGDLLLQKSFSTDHLTKKRKKNRGEKPQYYVENNHEPIVSKEVYEAVQLEFEHRREKHYKTVGASKYAFTGKIVCGNCGKNFRRKVTAARVVWICSTFDKHGKKECAAKQIPDETLCAAAAEVLGITEFDADIFEDKIENIIVPKANRLLFVFKDGHTVKQTWKDRSRKESWTPEMKEQARLKAFERRNAE